MSVDLYIDILDRALTRYGSGPITTAIYWRSNHPLDRSGGFEFEMAANDPQHAQVLPLRIVRAYAFVDGAWSEIASGVIENIQRIVGADGTVSLRVSGMDMLREYSAAINQLSYVGWAGSPSIDPMTHAEAVHLMESLPAHDILPWYLWDAIPDAGSPYSFSFACYGETCLYTVLRVAKMSFCHVFVSGFRQLTYGSTFADSGIVAVQAQGEIGANTCAIVNLEIETDTSAYASRVYARGGGNGVAELSMAYSTKTAPAGYTFNAAEGYIEHDALQATFPTSARVSFKDIIPITNTSGDIEAADNVLFDNALRWLQQHAGAYSTPLYRLSVAQCDKVLKPLQLIRVIYQSPETGIDVDQYLNILETTIQVDASGVRTTELAVSASDYWPQNESQTVASNLQQGQIYSTAAQPDVNNYAVSLRGHLNNDNNLKFSLRLGAEILQVQAVTFDFEILAFDDATVGLSSDATTGAEGTGATGASGTDATGAPSTDATAAASYTGSPSGPSTANTGDAGTGNTGDAGTGNTGDAGTGDTGAGSAHNHGYVVYEQSVSSGYPVNLVNLGGGIYQLQFYNAGASMGDIAFGTTNDSTHTHAGPSHNHTGPSHNHTGPSHAHTLSAHTHTSQAHTHTLSAHTHTGPSHTHTGPSHTHTAPAVAVTHGTWKETTGANISVVNDLTWSINGGAFVGGATPLTSGWYRIDMGTSLLDAFDRPITELNTIEFKTSSTSRSCVINAQISVRNIIQAVAVP